MKQSFIYRQYRGSWECLSGFYFATIESKLLQIFPKVEERINVSFSSSCEEELWDKIANEVNRIESLSYEEE